MQKDIDPSLRGAQELQRAQPQVTCFGFLRQSAGTIFQTLREEPAQDISKTLYTRRDIAIRYPAAIGLSNLANRLELLVPGDSTGPDIKVPASYPSVPQKFVQVPGNPDAWVGDLTPEVHAALERKAGRYFGLQGLSIQKTFGENAVMVVIKKMDDRGKDRYWPMYLFDKTALGPGQGDVAQETLSARNLVRLVTDKGGIQLDTSDRLQYTGTPDTINLLKDQSIIGGDSPSLLNMYQKKLITINGNEYGTKSMLGQTVQLETLNKKAETGVVEPKLPKYKIVGFEEKTGHNVIDVIQQKLDTDYGPTQLALFGLPLSEPYEVQIMENGVPTSVVMQIYQRSILTYNPSQPLKDWQLQPGLSGNLIKTAVFGNNPVPAFESQRSGTNATFPEWSRTQSRKTGEIVSNGRTVFKPWPDSYIGKISYYYPEDPDFPAKAVLLTKIQNIDVQQGLLTIDMNQGGSRRIQITPSTIMRMNLREVTIPGPLEDTTRYGANIWDLQVGDVLQIAANTQDQFISGNLLSPLGIDLYS